MMERHPPFTLWFYIARRFALTMLMVCTAFALIVLLLDVMELFRQYWREQIAATTVLKIALFKNYSTVERSLPFLVMVSSLLTYSGLTKSFELIVCRAFGMSVWQFLMPSVMLSFVLGVLLLLVFNPFGAYLNKSYNAMMQARSSNSAVYFAADGLWLQQKMPAQNQRIVVHAKHIDPSLGEMQEVVLLIFDNHNAFLHRIDSPNAYYENGNWILPKAEITDGQIHKKVVTNFEIPVNIPLASITRSMVVPESIPLFKLPKLMVELRASGLPILKYKMYFYKMIFIPCFLVSMVMLGVCFATRLERMGRRYLIQFFGLLSGFMVYVVSDVFYALGASGSINPALAALFAPLMVAMLSIYFLLHQEDG